MSRAGGVWQVLGRHAGTFAAAVPISASTPPPSETWAAELENLPREDGVDIRLVTPEGAGHGIVNDVYGEATLYRWLLRQERG